MEQEYFYLTITDDSNTFDAHELKENLGLYNTQAWNKGEQVEHEYIASQPFLRYLPKYSLDVIDIMFNRIHVSKLLDLPSQLSKTLHFVINGRWSRYGYSCHLDVNKLKGLALIQAEFTVHAQLHFPKVANEYPFIEHIADIEVDCIPEDRAYLSIYSHRHTIDYISKYLGLEPNHRFYNVDDEMGQSGRQRWFTLWSYENKDENKDGSVMDLPARLDTLIDDLYLHKDKIIQLGNEIDIDMTVSVNATVADNFECTISTEILKKLAQLQLSLNVDMSFKNID